jgi:protein SCO1/2
MTSKGRYPKALILIVVALVVLAALASSVVHQANKSRSQIPVWGEVPDFEFAAQTNQPFGLEEMRGKLTVIDFIFTNCQMVCPVLASRFTELYDLYKGSDMVQLVSITVDPERDTPEILQAYAADLGVADSRWVFLRAPLDDVVALCEKGFMLAADDLPGGHTSKLILVDEQGKIRNYYDGMDESHLEFLKTDIRQLASELL